MKTIHIHLIAFIALWSITGCSQSGKRRKSNKTTTESVVQTQPINTAQLSSNSALSLQDLYQKNKAAVFLIYTSDGEKYHQGSGFFITEDGIGVSNYHVFENTFKGQEIIKMLNGKQYRIAEVIIANKELDYIIFKVAGQEGEKFPFTIVSSNPPVIGENVFAIGNPKGLESTLSTGIVSSLRESESLIQTTAEITNGSSGGPLFNMDGEVIGITSSGMGEANLNFAIDIMALHLK